METEIFSEEESLAILEKINTDLDSLTSDAMHLEGSSAIKIIKAHLLTERMVYYLIEAIDPKLIGIQKLELSFDKAITLLELISKDVPFVQKYIQYIRGLNNIRNHVAHKLKSDTDKITNYLRSLKGLFQEGRLKTEIEKRTDIYDYLDFFTVSFSISIVSYSVFSHSLNEKKSDLEKRVNEFLKLVE